jgi:ankyrin repeat protein
MQLFKKEENPTIEINKYLPIYEAILNNHVDSLGNVKSIINKIPYKQIIESPSGMWSDTVVHRYPPALIYAFLLRNQKKLNEHDSKKLNNINSLFTQNDTTSQTYSTSPEQLMDIINVLIKKQKANPYIIYNNETLFNYARRYADDELFNALLNNGVNINEKDSNTALISGIYFGDIGIVQLLLEKDADVNAKDRDGKTALMHAINKPSDMVELLIEKGAKLDMKDNDGKTALMHAVQYNDMDAVALLLRNRADPNITDNEGKTALMLAICFPNFKQYQKEKYGENKHEITLQIVNMLIMNDADLNKQDKKGNTALIHVVKYLERFPTYFGDPSEAYYKIVNVLLEKGANPNIKDKTGKTALDYADPDSDISTLLTPKRKGGSTKSRRLKTKKTVKKYRKKTQN